jgi:biopolymer transport protein TolR
MAYKLNISRSKNKRATISEINITPFVDVLLVLLVIFMISSPMITSSVNIDLPKGSKNPIKENNLPISVSVKSDGSLYLQDEPIKTSDLDSGLLKITGNNLDTKIYVHADKSLDYGKVMSIVSLIGSNGFNKVILVTEIIK